MHCLGQAQEGQGISHLVAGVWHTHWRQVNVMGGVAAVALLVSVAVSCNGETNPSQTPVVANSTPTAKASPAPTATVVVPTATPSPKPTSPIDVPTAPTPTALLTPMPAPREDDPFARWNSILEPQPWWKESAPYSCLPATKETSPWLEAGMTDLGGDDELSLIRWYGNGSYLRYGLMGFEGCTPIEKRPDRTHLGPWTLPTTPWATWT